MMMDDASSLRLIHRVSESLRLRYIVARDAWLAWGLCSRFHDWMILHIARGSHVSENRLGILMARWQTRFVPVTIVSNSDWLLSRWTDACRDYLCKELFILWIWQQFIQVAVWVEINNLRLTLVIHTVRTSALPWSTTTCCMIMMLRDIIIYNSRISNWCVLFHCIVVRSWLTLLLNFFLECHGLRACVEWYRLDASLSLLCWGDLWCAMVLGNRWLCFGEFNYGLELFRIFQIEGILGLSKWIWDHFWRLFEIATDWCLHALLRSLRFRSTFATLIHYRLLCRCLWILASLSRDNRTLRWVFWGLIKRIASLLLATACPLGPLSRKVLLDELIKHYRFSMLLDWESRIEVLNWSTATNDSSTLYIFCIALLDSWIDFE